jgi:hypothetical protein
MFFLLPVIALQALCWLCQKGLRGNHINSFAIIYNFKYKGLRKTKDKERLTLHWQQAAVCHGVQASLPQSLFPSPHNQPVQFQEFLRGAAELIQATGCAFFGLLFKLIR